MRFLEAIDPSLRARWRRGILSVLLSTAVALPGCVFQARRVEVVPVVPGNAPETIVNNPVKAHLNDGSTVVFPRGLSISGGSLHGQGTRYDLTLSKVTPVTVVPLDAVAALESFHTATKAGESVVVSLLATGAAVVAGTLLAVAIFGSCPTVYSQDEQGPLLEADVLAQHRAPARVTRRRSAARPRGHGRHGASGGPQRGTGDALHQPPAAPGGGARTRSTGGT